MKKFAFSLGRVMEFRRIQARVEEIKLENLYAELRAIDAREAALVHQSALGENALREQQSVSGFDLELFGTHREAIKKERKRMDKARAECRGRIDAQLAVLAAKRRDVKLIERLKEQRFTKWEQEMLKEIDRQAEEAYLAKWNRE
ncbi:MAG TPA: hypothetical protein VMT15_05875 [Bryobacteraceae bacterium]|nr:hypothetical protein [Bryobacteraceae bacterium]